MTKNLKNVSLVKIVLSLLVFIGGLIGLFFILDNIFAVVIRSFVSLALFYWGVRGCNFAVREILGQFECSAVSCNSTNPGKQGFAIGIFERFLIITTILLGRYEAIGWMP